MRTRARGFSYIEVTVALLLLAICLVPAMEAVRNATRAPLVAQQTGQALACLKTRMEAVAGEPYQLLLNAAGTQTAPSSYSLAADIDGCPVRDVFIARYDPDASPNFTSADTGLLYIAVSTRGASGASPMTLTTLVAR